MPDVQFQPIGTSDVPADWVLPGALEIILKACFAHFDGSGAGGSFVPVLTIESDSGTLAAEIAADTTIAAGSSADVSWFPGGQLAGGGSGIQFDVDNVGGWLEVETTAFVGASFSQPSGLTAVGDDATNYGEALNTKWGIVMSADPTSPNVYVLNIVQGTTGAHDASGLFVNADTTGGSGNAVGQAVSAASDATAASAIEAGASSNTGTAQAVNGVANQNDAGGATDALGVFGHALVAGAGSAVGLQGRAQATGAGKAIGLRIQDHTGKSIVELRDDGTWHGLAAVGAITWDLV